MLKHKEVTKTIILSLLIGAIVGFVGGIKVSADNQAHLQASVANAVKASQPVQASK